MQTDAFETRLKKLTPVPGALDPVTAAYAAGRQSARRTLNGWRGIAGAAVMIAIAAWVMPWAMPGKRQGLPFLAIAPQSSSDFTGPTPALRYSNEPGRTSKNPSFQSTSESASSNDLWQLEAAVLENGLDGLPKIAIPPVRPSRDFEAF